MEQIRGGVKGYLSFRVPSLFSGKPYISRFFLSTTRSISNTESIPDGKEIALETACLERCDVHLGWAGFQAGHDLEPFLLLEWR